MKGWQFTKTHEPLKLVEQEDPKAAPGRVVIDTKAVGLCHSDVGSLEDEGWMALMDAPVIMGHENAGVISEVGEGVTDFKVGDRVAICPTGPSRTAPGYAYDGGFGTKIHAPAEDLVRVPDELSMEMAASATDAGMTSYSALFNVGQAKPGMNIALIGIGGLGQFALQAAVAKGIKNIYAADVSEKARELAKEIGAAEVVSDIKDLADKDLDLIVDYAGFGVTTSDALEVVKPGGTVVLVGMGKLETTINTTSFITGAKRLLANVGGTPQDIAEIYELMAAGKLNPKLTKIKFENIPEGIEKLKAGEVQGRLVAVYDGDE
ncbi:alcohol dehydrogenase [Bhargavaea cecembensis]|uniref:Alcohol dehydrogenase n=1 Tax=Bhargavaea cecembensis TaxID=394098 RepID=A0A161RHK6_9BACL|nr:zinc-binding dehydrogenase [Bhargavaea cecembensis]KZE37548.1 alcohol dehydrogenase [Bhargavaea cecembensis]